MSKIDSSIIKQLVSLCAIAADDATRYHMCHVKIDRVSETHLRMTAVDGHKSMTLNFTDIDASDWPEHGFIENSKENVRDLKEILRRTKASGVVDLIDGHITSGGLSVQVKVDGEILSRFPNIDAVYPKYKSEPVHVSINAEYLLELAKTLQDGTTKNPFITLAVIDSTAPIQVYKGEHHGLLMPVRLDKKQLYSKE